MRRLSSSAHEDESDPYLVLKGDVFGVSPYHAFVWEGIVHGEPWQHFFAQAHRHH